MVAPFSYSTMVCWLIKLVCPRKKAKINLESRVLITLNPKCNHTFDNALLVQFYSILHCV